MIAHNRNPPPDVDVDALERRLVALARDPENAVWESGWSNSPAMRQVLAGLFEELNESIGRAAGFDAGLTCQSIRWGLHALGELTALLNRIALERAALVLALLRNAGLRVSVRDGQLLVGPADRLTDEHRSMIGDWKSWLIVILTRAGRGQASRAGHGMAPRAGQG